MASRIANRIERGNPTLLHLPFTTVGALIPEDANCVSHVTWNGSALVDSKGLAWTMVGTVPQIATSQLYPSGFGAASRPGAGPFDANYYELGTGSDVLDFAGDFLGVAIVNLLATTDCLIISNGTQFESGYYLQINSGECYATHNRAGGYSLATLANAATLRPGLHVICFGRYGLKACGKVDFGGFTSGVDSAIVAGTAFKARIGRNAGAGDKMTNGLVHEVYFSTTTPTDALFTSIVNHVIQHKGTCSEILTVTRNLRGSYEI